MKKSTLIIDSLNKHYFLNLRIGAEYLKISQQLYNFGMKNLSCYIKKLAEDKLTAHKDRLFQYMIDQNIEINGNIDEKFNEKFNKPIDAIKYILNQEKDIKVIVNQMSVEALKNDDHETFHFLTWFVNDGSKDYLEIKHIYNLLNLTNDLLGVDQAVGELK